ncbi:hypothetical protein Trco_008333 [Trichoderma cornu-damae]|uniref:NADH dehydrogenase [ubiquinone] 1 alpha subcomplex assembly factor 3 n=1 Tax=Trichoderma cornu-damae TaxID=654480 RepID=A0A9P8QIG9_9HYPO|nr:hypothetical protein Trco_008333 [Trichoderma cornu-damae]
MASHRVTYRRRNGTDRRNLYSYNTRSNRTRVIKTPGGDLRVLHIKKRGTVPKCGDCGSKLSGIPALRPREYAQISKPQKTVQRAYGGSRCGNCVRDRIVRAFLIEEQKIVKKDCFLLSATASERYSIVQASPYHTNVYHALKEGIFSTSADDARVIATPAASHTASNAQATQNRAPNGLRKSFHSMPSLSRRRDDAPPDTPPPTNFSELNVLGGVPVPSTSVDVCMHDGFGLNSGITISGGDGALLVSGEAFAWRPWEASGKMKLVNEKGQFELPGEAFGLFDGLWPRPDLLIIGVGRHNLPLSPETRQRISELGMRVEMLDTRNAAAQFNLLATERGVSEVAAALIPIGWEEGLGVVS